MALVLLFFGRMAEGTSVARATMNTAERVEWLQQQTMLGALSAETLRAIATAIQEQHLGDNRRLILEGTLPSALYILRSGRLESYRTNLTTAARAVSLLPGSILHLKELLLNQPAEYTVITLSDCELWCIPATEFTLLVERYPDINLVFSRQLVAELQSVTSQLAFEQEKQTALRPYLVPKVKRGIIGTSRYALRLRQDIKKAAADRKPVLIFGEPGLGKDNVAALVHFGGNNRKQPLIKVNCDVLQANGADLFGRVHGKPGLLDWLGAGTLMLNNVQEIPKALEPQLIRLLTTGEYTPVSREGELPAPWRQSQARVVMTSERTMPEVERQGAIAHIIKVPPLRVRKADVAAYVDYFLSLTCRARGLEKPDIAPEAIRRLQGYDFPGNVSELESLVERAVLQSNGARVLTEEVFWSTSPREKRFRLNLLNAYPQLRQFLRSSWWPDRLNRWVVLPAFALVVAILILGPQRRASNIGLNLFWAWWWPLILIGYPFVGRVWCAICPFMIYGELVQSLSLNWFPRQLRPWPRQAGDRWGPWFLFGLFTLILLWEELWHLEDTPYLSACLLLLITSGAIVFSLIFERRFWCRYLCPIGGMNGMFAKLSMIELRAQQGICSATCTTYQCYKGGPQKGEGQETEGCPVYSHPAQLQDNRDCVLCMTCLKACPHRSVELNFRPPGIELWTTHKPVAAEVCLLFLLWGAVLLHRLPEINTQFGLSLPLESFGVHAALSVLVLLLPGAIALLAYRGGVWCSGSLKPRPFIELAYGYLPLVLGCNLAHYLRLGLTEAGQVIPVTLATFGFSGTALPVAIAHPAVIAFLQGITLMVTTWLTIFLTQKIARQPFANLWPHHLAAIGLGGLVWKVVVGW